MFLAQPPPAQGVNFVTTFGADPSGVASSDAAITAFNAYFATAVGDVTLVIPAGTYNTSGNINFARTASTADSLTVYGYGGVFSTHAVGWGSNVTYDDNTHQARIQTVESGSMTLTLVTLADHSLFSVGDWALMTGLDLQGFGSPPNPQWHEYVQIAAIDTGTGVITLEDPLDHSYSSTWPHYNSGNAFTPDMGGPATLYAINQTWDLDIFIKGLALNGTDSQEYAKFRHVEYIDCSWGSGTPGPTPTANLYYKWDNCTILSTGLEPDKLVTTLEIHNTTMHSITFQSASVTDVVISGSTIFNLTGNGGGDTTISNSTIQNSWTLSPIAYGACLGTHAFSSVAAPSSSALGNPQGGTYTLNTNLYTHTGSGVFTIAKASGPQAWAVPGARCIVSGSNGSITQFTVMDVAESGSNTVITTDLGGAFPTAPSGWGATVNLAPRATNYITASGMTGDSQILNMNNDGAQGLPLNSYFKKTYTNSFSPAALAYCNGKMVSFSINVTTAYAGATSTVACTPDQFHVFGTLDSTYAAYDFMPSINAKVAGARVFRPGGITGTQSGDSVVTPPSLAPWISQGIAPFLSGSVADGSLTIVFEVIFDQDAIALNSVVQSTSMFATTTFALDPKNYYTPGNESPAVSTADYYHMHACQYMGPYDLDTMGADGAAVKAANGGNRYVWFMSGEHPAGGGGIPRDATGIKMGFSNDPGVFPPYVLDVLPQNNQFVGDSSTPGANGYTMHSDMMPSSLVYNPDDPSTPFWLWTQGYPTAPSFNWATQGTIWKSADMLHWQGAGWSPKDLEPTVANIPSTTPSNLTSQQKVTRVATGEWTSIGPGMEVARSGITIWTGTDGTDFVSPSRLYNYTGFPTVSLTLSGLTLTAGSAIFSSSDVGKGVAIVYDSGNSVLAAISGVTPTRIATYVSPFQVTLNANAVGASLSSQTLPFQIGNIAIQTAPAPYSAGGTSQFNPSMISAIVRIGYFDYALLVEDARHAFQASDNGMHASLAPVDSNFNISQTRAVKRIADYSGIYTGQGYIIGVMGYYEDGILHSYVELGYPGPFAANPYPFVGARTTGSLSGTTLTLTAVAGFVTIGALVYTPTTYVGQITAQTSGTAGSTGTYTVENSQGASASAGTAIQINSGTDYNTDSTAEAGGFRQQHVQYITSSCDDFLVAKAAPFGVSASCSSNTVTISWMQQTLRSGAPAQSYHVYRGTSSGSQTTSIGTTSSLSITDTPTPGSVYYYKVVKIAAGVEQTTKYRVVHTYVG